MTVKEIFALRKQGKIEEAYVAIRARYATYRGKYTTLCMFWTAADVFKLRLEQKRYCEATKIFQALRRVLPNIDDKDGRVAGFMHFAGSQLSATVPAGSPAGPPASSVLSDSVASSVLSDSPGLAPAGSPSASVLSDSVASSVLSDSVAEGLNPGQQSVLDCIKAHEGINVPRISEATNIPSKSIERHISAPSLRLS